jgi:hypothetical protein
LAKENWSPKEKWKLPLKKGFNKMTKPKKKTQTHKENTRAICNI